MPRYAGVLAAPARAGGYKRERPPGHDLARDAYPVKRQTGLVPEESNVHADGNFQVYSWFRN